ncbi:PIG-L family deacetylase [Williamsia sp. CHRR-6]|uniref:PIG-L family deacetylase n=1 Tax=Williamsia sp. CHRR-6 TaxID=2835871 RepID=UPI001BD98C3E|nr:PIG-L family deacetylase [Williamsia sp. CHRR-6]MBT0568186.1 PIG-L family deacetylase [Williamsia sp. CHRR-6]
MSHPSVLFIHAHPDDESLWTGGTLARAVDLGAQVSLLTCTWTPGTLRHRELGRALQVLGGPEAIMLGYADIGFPESAPAAAPLAQAPVDSVIRRITETIRRIKPEVVITYDAFGIYGHPDHIATHRLALAAVEAASCAPMYRALGDPWQVSSVYLSTLPTSLTTSLWEVLTGTAPRADQVLPGTPDSEIDLALDVSQWRDKKVAAIASHRSEIERSPELTAMLSLDRQRLDTALCTEWYLRRDVVGSGADLDLR